MFNLMRHLQICLLFLSVPPSPSLPALIPSFFLFCLFNYIFHLNLKYIIGNWEKISWKFSIIILSCAQSFLVLAVLLMIGLCALKNGIDVVFTIRLCFSCGTSLIIVSDERAGSPGWYSLLRTKDGFVLPVTSSPYLSRVFHYRFC